MRWVVAFLLLAMATLAGCADNAPKEVIPGEESDGQEEHRDDADDHDDSEAPPTPPAEEDNNPPTMAFTANVTGGATPLGVVFNITGSDVDGDELAWNVSFGDGSDEATGLGLPATFNHTFAAEGLYNVTATVSDGLESITATLEVNVSSAPPLGFQPVVLAGHLTGPDPFAATGEGCVIALFRLAGGPDNFGNRWQVDGAWRGRSYQTAPDGIIVSMTNGAQPIGAGPSGTIPTNAVDLFSCGTGPDNVDQDYTVTIF